MNTLLEAIKVYAEWLDKLRVFGAPAWKLAQVEQELEAYRFVYDLLARSQ